MKGEITMKQSTKDTSAIFKMRPWSNKIIFAKLFGGQQTYFQ